MLLDTHVSFEATLPLIYNPKTYGTAGPKTFQEWISLCFMRYLVRYPMRSFIVVHAALGKSELRAAMTVRMRPIY